MERIHTSVTFDRNATVILTKSESAPEIPFWCPLCSCVMGNDRDVNAHRGSGVCGDCEQDFADTHRIEWMAGWRPSKKEVNKQLKKRFRTLLDKYLKLS